MIPRQTMPLTTNQKYQAAQKQMSDIAENPELMKTLFQLVSEMKNKNEVAIDKIKFDNSIVKYIKNAMGISQFKLDDTKVKYSKGKHFPNSIISVFNGNGSKEFFVLTSGKKLVIGEGKYGRVKFAARVIDEEHLDLNLRAMKIQKVDLTARGNKPEDRKAVIFRPYMEYWATSFCLPSSYGYLCRKLDSKMMKSYIDMPYIDGGITLEDFLAKVDSKKYNLTLAQRFKLAIKVLMAVDKVHKVQGFIHHDLKPDNIMLVGNPKEPDTLEVVLIDFGLSKSIDDEEVYTRGSPAYMPPELLEKFQSVISTGKLDDYKTDIYALGYILGRIFGESDSLILRLKNKAYLLAMKKGGDDIERIYAVIKCPLVFDGILSGFDKTEPGISCLYTSLKHLLNQINNAHKYRPELNDLILSLNTIHWNYLKDTGTKQIAPLTLFTRLRKLSSQAKTDLNPNNNNVELNQDLSIHP